MSSYNKTTFGNIDPKCSKHSTQMPSALSSTILDYYHKYGRNRDLEKYLRFRNRTSSGSSSIQLSPTDSPTRAGKSLENINILESCLEPEKSAQKSKSSESLNKSGHSKPDGTMEKSGKSPIADNQIKLTSKKAVKSKKKYNINMDTCIEITLPQQLPHPPHQQQMLPPFDPLTQHDFSQQKIEFGTSETQTEQRIEFPKTPNRSDIEVIEMPARPSSVASSAASISNKQRLEWDSMADVGYYKSTAESNNLTNLTEFERKALKKFFASHGVNFDDEMVMFASKSKLSNSVPELTKQAEKARIREKWEVAFQKILEEKYAKRNGKNKEGKVDRKRLWQSALVKFREKYGTHFNPETDLCITEPAVHSTPILTDSTKGAISKVRGKTLDTKSQTDDERTEQVEKACQTSMVVTSSKECQVDVTTSDVYSALHFQGISSTDNSKESEKSADCKEGLISATSFEFFAPGVFTGQDKENIHPCKKDKDFPPKVNVERRDENKENVPPKVPAYDEIEENVHLSTPRNITAESSHTDEMFGVISTLENDLTKGVEVLYSLANSKELNEEKKKKLVRQIIKRITNAKYKDSTASSESIVSSFYYDSGKSKSVVGNPHSKPNISGVNTLSSTSSSRSSKELSSAKEKSSLKQDNSKDSSIKDWLKPITNSEVEHERKKSKEKELEIESKRRMSKASFNSDESRCDSNIIKFVEKQRQSQFDWIDKEICHLVNLKEYLNKKRETDIMTDIINLELNRKESSSAAGSNKSKESGVIYENVNVHPAKAQINYAEVKTQRISKTKTCSYSEGKVSRPSSKESAVKECTQTPNEKDRISDASSSTEWNSHVNMQQFVRDRKKLQTPNEDINSYAHAKEQEFIGKYECIRSRPIYTQPYSSDHSDHYSEPRDNDRKTSSKKNINHAYTSITGSDGFLSSDSVSIPVANSTSNNTTTHQYDTRASVAIQTSSSLARTAPIFKTKPAACNCGPLCHCINTRRPTIRVKYQTNDKQLQVMPKAICYDIGFDDEKKQKKDTKDHHLSGSRTKTEIYSRHSDSDSTTSKDSKNKSERNFVGNFGGCAKLSLQDHLKSARPGFVSQADERRKCVAELHNLREKRNEQRNRLFLLSSNHSLRNHIKTLNPPIAGKRMFTTKALKQQTRNRYNKLPEIVSKEENERQNRIKRSNRIVRDMFNKNLQTRVLKGQTDLSNSVSVAAI